MIQMLKGPRDIGGNLAKSLATGYQQAQQAHEEEQKTVRGEQRKMQMLQQDEARQESRLREALQKAYADPDFQSEDPLKRQSVLYKHIAPVNPEVANKIATADIANMKAQQPGKKPASQVDPQQAKILDLYRDSDKYKKGTPSEVHTDILSLTNDKNLANSMRAAKQAETTASIEKDKNVLKKDIADESSAIKYHERSDKFMAEAKDEAKIAENTEMGIRQMSESMNRKDNPQFGYGAFRAGAASFLPTTLMEQFLSPDEATFEAAIPNLLEGMKDLFGVRLSDADLRLVRGKLPSLGKSKEANEQILGFLQNMADIKKLKYKIAREEERKYPKNRPASFQRDVEDKYEEQATKLKDKYFAEFRLPSKDVKGIKKQPMAKNMVRLVSPEGKVLEYNKDEKDAVDYLKRDLNYLILQES